MNWLKRLLGGGEKEGLSTVTVPNVWGVGDGQPFTLPRDPNVSEIFAQATQPERSILLYAYLNHPDSKVRLATIAEAGRMGGYYLSNQSLVDRLADPSSDVRKAAARALWADPEAVEDALRCLRDEIHRSGLRSTMSPQEAIRGLEFLRQAAPSAKDLTQFKEWVAEIIGAEQSKSGQKRSTVIPNSGERTKMKGIQTLEELCSRYDILDTDPWVERAVQDLKPEGAKASRALAELLVEFLECRTPKLLDVLGAAIEMEPTRELIEAVHSIAAASSMAHQPVRSRFSPEISDGDQVGWTEYTAERIKSNANVVLERLKSEKAVESPIPAGSERSGLDSREASQSGRIYELRQSLSSDDWTLGVQAARALGSIGSLEAAKALAKGLEGDAHGAIPTDTFRVIAEELARLDRELLIRKLCQMYRKLPHLHAKKGDIIEALGNIGGPEALSTLRQALSDKDTTVVWYAKKALGKLGHQM